MDRVKTEFLESRASAARTDRTVCLAWMVNSASPECQDPLGWQVIQVPKATAVTMDQPAETVFLDFRAHQAGMVKMASVECLAMRELTVIRASLACQDSRE